ncbi:MAG TPA: hypothetical protein VIQ02_05700 [Jiangellaceae bacterium]
MAWTERSADASSMFHDTRWRSTLVSEIWGIVGDVSWTVFGLAVLLAVLVILVV